MRTDSFRYAEWHSGQVHVTQTLKDTGERVVPLSVEPDDVMASTLLQQHLERYEEVAGRLSGGLVVDAGCGAGYGSKMISELCEEVLALDISSECLDYAREHYDADNITYRRFDFDATDDSLPEAVDAIVCFEALQHVESPRSVLLKFRNALSANGKLFISATTYDSTNIYKYHKHDYTRESFRQELLDAGFVIEDEFEQVATISAKDMRRVMFRHSESFPIARLFLRPQRVLGTMWRSFVHPGLEHSDLTLICSPD